MGTDVWIIRPGNCQDRVPKYHQPECCYEVEGNHPEQHPSKRMPKQRSIKLGDADVDGQYEASIDRVY